MNDPQFVQRLLTLAEQEATHPGKGRLFALVDGALCREAYALLKDSMPLHSVQPPGGLVAYDDRSVLPFFIDLCALVEFRRAQTMKNLVAWASHSSAVTWFSSLQAPEELVPALGQRMEACLDGDLGVLLRFADARVLPVLQKVLEPAQSDRYFGFATGWWYIGRGGELEQLPLGAREQTAPYSGPLRLTQAQEQKLIDAAEPDAIIHLLTTHDSQQLDRMSLPDRYGFVKSCIGKARAWSLLSATDLALYCMVGLEFGPDFEKMPEWAAALCDARDQKTSLLQAIQRREAQ